MGRNFSYSPMVLQPLLDYYGEEGLELLAAYLQRPDGQVLVTDRVVVLARKADSLLSFERILAGDVGQVDDALFIHFAWGQWKEALRFLPVLDVEWLIYERKGRRRTLSVGEFLRLSGKQMPRIDENGLFLW